MKIDVAAEQSKVLINIQGELDRDTLESDLWEMLDNNALELLKKNEAVELNLSNVNRADTAGLAWLLNAIRDFRAHDHNIEISHIPKKLLQLAKLSNADTLITEKREEA